MTGFDPEKGFVSESTADLRARNAELELRVMTLEESFDDAAAAMIRLNMEDEGWQLFGQVRKDDGFSLKVLKEVSRKAEVQCVGNPLLKRGFELRFNPIFSRGFEVSGDSRALNDKGEVKPRFQRRLDSQSVRDILFSEEGWEQNERTLYVSGNLFVAYNRITGRMMRIPFAEITDRAVDPDVPAETAYYQRSHTRTTFDGQTENIIEWYPTVEWWESGNDNQDKVGQYPVNHDWVIIDMRVNVPTVGHWGLPDVFPALPYAWAYAEWIRDAASLLKAYTTIAWKVVGRNKTVAQTAGVSVAGARKVGSVASMTPGTDLQSMKTAGSVDMNDGLALAAMVASAVEVNVSALLSNGTVGGAAGTVQALDGPTVAMARSRQSRWTNFYNRVFRALGIEGLTINFPKITEDPIHRQIASLATVRATGGLWADEYRAAVLEALSVKPMHDDAPDVEEYAQAQNALGFLNMMEQIRQAQEPENDPLARQGNSGVAGNLGQNMEIDNSNRDRDNLTGGGTQTDLTG